MKKRRKDDREFKQMVVELSNPRDDITVRAKELDIRAELIYCWSGEALANLDVSFPSRGNKMMTEEQKEIARLKKEL